MKYPPGPVSCGSKNQTAFRKILTMKRRSQANDGISAEKLPRRSLTASISSDLIQNPYPCGSSLSVSDSTESTTDSSTGSCKAMYRCLDVKPTSAPIKRTFSDGTDVECDDDDDVGVTIYLIAAANLSASP